MILRALLKRISMILTAPPKVTVKDYYELKNLCQPKSGGKCIIIFSYNYIFIVLF